MKIFFQFVVLKKFHHAQAVDLCLLIQRNELEVFRILGHVLKRSLDSIEVVGSNRGVLSCSAEGIVQLLLSSNKGLVGLIIEGDVSEDSSSDKGPDLLYLSNTKGTDESIVIEVVGCVNTTLGTSAFPR